MADNRPTWTYINKNGIETIRQVTAQENKWATNAPTVDFLKDPELRGIRKLGYYDEVPDSAEHNWVFALHSRMLASIEGRGILQWCALTDYVPPAIVWGQDGTSSLYLAVLSSGPTHGGAVDPATESPPTYWQRVSFATPIIGQIITVPYDTPPAFTLVCDGSEYLAANYPELYGVLGNIYGGTPGTSFIVPDYRGYFLRGLDTESVVDVGSEVAKSGNIDHLSAIMTFTTPGNVGNLEIGQLLVDVDCPGYVVTITPGTVISSINFSATAIDAALPQQISLTLNNTLSLSPDPGAPVPATLTFTNRLDRGDGTTGAEIGTVQAANAGAHRHPLTYRQANTTIASTQYNYAGPYLTPTATNIFGTSSGTYLSYGADTRGVNKTVLYCIRYL